MARKAATRSVKLRSIQGLEEFRLTRADLRGLGERAVTLDVTIGVPPFIYPSTSLRRRLIAKAPAARLALVRQWRRQQFERLCRELEFKGETLWFDRAPIGLRLTIPARFVNRLRSLRHAESITIQEIEGRRRILAPGPERDRLYAVRARLVYQLEGQRHGFQVCEDRVTVLKARSETQARRRAERVLRDEGHPYLTASGRFGRLAFEEILDVIELFDERFVSTGTEVYYEFRNRRVKRHWKPVA